MISSDEVWWRMCRWNRSEYANQAERIVKVKKG